MMEPKVMNWFLGLFRAAKPDPQPTPVKAEFVRLDWEKLAIDVGMHCGRIRKGNSFAFSMGLAKCSATVPVPSFNRLVAAGIIDEQGIMQEQNHE